MAQSLGAATRGRKKEPLRLDAARLAATVSAGKGTTEMTVDVTRETGEADTLTITVPKGTVAIPHELTAAKTVANVREITRLALIDAGLSETVKVHREPFRFAPIHGEVGYVPTASEKRKGYKESTTESPVSDAWYLMPKENDENN